MTRLHQDDQGGAPAAARRAQGTQQNNRGAQAGRGRDQDWSRAQYGYPANPAEHKKVTPAHLPEEPKKIELGNAKAKINAEQTRVSHGYPAPPPPTVGQLNCITSPNKKSNSGPNSLRKEFSTESMRQKCNILPYSVDQWIGNWILPHFDPKMSSLGLLEAKIIPKLRTTGNYCHGCYFWGCGGGLVVGVRVLGVGGGRICGDWGVLALVLDFRQVMLTSPPELAHCAPLPNKKSNSNSSAYWIKIKIN